MDASESDSSQNSLDAMEMSSDVCLYSMVEIRMDSEGMSASSSAQSYCIIFTK